MTSPRAHRGRTYASERYPWTYRTWAEETPTGGMIFGGETNPHFPREIRLLFGTRSKRSDSRNGALLAVKPQPSPSVSPPFAPDREQPMGEARRVKVNYGLAVWDQETKGRFMANIARIGGCWIWQGSLSPNGYGVISIGNQKYAAHRLAKTKMHGAVPVDMVCDHTCRNRACVNPDHIDVVSNRENLMRGDGPSLLRARNEAITHCPKGHEYTPENTRFNKRKSRICRACDKDHHVRLNVRRKAARARASIGKGE